MSLWFGLTFMSGLADETPTPTRFIRNCEEVGLFQDLQNVNPFDGNNHFSDCEFVQALFI